MILRATWWMVVVMLAAAGFAVAEVWGDFDGEPYDGASPHLILLAEKQET